MYEWLGYDAYALEFCIGCFMLKHCIMLEYDILLLLF